MDAIQGKREVPFFEMHSFQIYNREYSKAICRCTGSIRLEIKGLLEMVNLEPRIRAIPENKLENVQIDLLEVYCSKLSELGGDQSRICF